MFLGEYTHSLDSKFRLTVPSKFRHALAAGIVVTRSPTEPCLLAFPLDEWEKVATKIDALPKMDRKANRLRRSIFSRAEMLELDRQGRILISQRLREYANIEDEVVLAGVNSHFELWNPQTWEEINETLDDDMLEAFDV